MSETNPKSKLKRRKPSAEKLHPEISSRDTPKRDRPTLFCRGWTAEADGSVVPAAAWWNRERLPAVESLWAFTLKSALPYLENQRWDLVPDLPHPSAAKPAALELDEQRLCDCGEDVAPLPEPAPPSPRTSTSPDPLRLSSSQQDNSVQTKPAPHTPDRQLSSHSRQSHHGKTAALPALSERQSPSLRSWEAAASSASVGGGEQEEEAGPVNRQVKVCDSRAPLQREGENKEEVVKDKEEEQMQGSVRGDGGAAGGRGGGGGGELQSCPMCLLVFPIGFTQMDCDGHLAQCLSEMNVDMTW
ncbi:uncharacterized protein si:ch73-70k4.1 [Toxotes jaculatrix]|uniref:uncharacterized protein si:ch73-70k4.1 n=1 Tax=Toxotes jaculatrix TaxID=941984 RepID=UPI001B3A9BD7|nr:uncharacterized protein si:ch73-70k4.1 [Toxotes jaculatrix]